MIHHLDVLVLDTLKPKNAPEQQDEMMNLGENGG